MISELQVSGTLDSLQAGVLSNTDSVGLFPTVSVLEGELTERQKVDISLLFCSVWLFI